MEVLRNGSVIAQLPNIERLHRYAASATVTPVDITYMVRPYGTYTGTHSHPETTVS